MKKLIIPMALAVMAGVITSAGLLNTSNSSGKTIFLDNKCSKCHSIESQGIKHTSEPPEGAKYPPPDLSDVGNRHAADWMQKWLQKEEEQHGKKHMIKFKGSDDELKTLTAWLASLKKKG
jgi:cbb3-type cytochrome oxidase cytochrome c subunit